MFQCYFRISQRLKTARRPEKITCMPYQDPLASAWDGRPEVRMPRPLSGQLVSHFLESFLTDCAWCDYHGLFACRELQFEPVEAGEQVLDNSCTVKQGPLSSEL